MSQTIRAAGPFRLHKANPARPRRQHATFESAEGEARRLHAQDPTSSFVILQEIARVGANLDLPFEQAA